MSLGGSNAMRDQANALSYRAVAFVENRGTRNKAQRVRSRTAERADIG